MKGILDRSFSHSDNLQEPDSLLNLTDFFSEGKIGIERACNALC